MHDLRTAQRVWITNHKFTKRPGIILDFVPRYVVVLFPTKGTTEGNKFKFGSITVLDIHDYDAWSTKWDDIEQGKFLFT